jgi:hypothetical protein
MMIILCGTITYKCGWCPTYLKFVPTGNWCIEGERKVLLASVINLWKVVLNIV